MAEEAWVGGVKDFGQEPGQARPWGHDFDGEERAHKSAGARVERSAGDPTVPVELVGSDGDPYPCSLLGIGLGRAHLHSEIPMPESWGVRLHFDSLSIPGEVQYSTRDGDGWRICVSVGSEPERNRMEPRFPINQAGRITILNPVGSICCNCVLTNISRSGLGLTAAEPAEPGAMVYVVGNFGLVVGEVRHCSQGADGRYGMGLETMGVYASVESVLPDVAGMGRVRFFIKKLRRKVAEAIAGSGRP
jgi:hypothetical protein